MSIEIAAYIAIDHSKMLQEKPACGHNQWHPNIDHEPVTEVKLGQVVGQET